MVTGLAVLFNTLNIRRSIIPAANGHCSARALARYYATLVTGGIIPPPHTSLSKPLLGSHVHIPKFPSWKKDGKKAEKKKNGKAGLNNILPLTKGSKRGYSRIDNKEDLGTKVTSIFQNPKINDAFTGTGDYRNLVIADGKFGLSFRRFESSSCQMTSFGHSGVGGSTGFCDVEHKFAMAVTVNKMSLGGTTARIIQLVCSELNVPLPEEFSPTGEKGPDTRMQIN